MEDLSNWIENKVINRTSKVENLLAFKKVLKRLRINTPKEIITIGGTNGKGTLAELISQLSLKKGISIGTFTSPHIINFNERIKINGPDIHNRIEEPENVGFNKTYSPYRSTIKFLTCLLVSPTSNLSGIKHKNTIFTPLRFELSTSIFIALPEVKPP